VLNRLLRLKLTEAKKELNPDIPNLVNDEVNTYDLVTWIKKTPGLIAENKLLLNQDKFSLNDHQYSL
jgi:hypothetical protein